MKRTQSCKAVKLKEKYLRPYEITAAKNHYRYEVKKGYHECPRRQPEPNTSSRGL